MPHSTPSPPQLFPPPLFLFAYFSFVIGLRATAPGVPSTIYTMSFFEVDGALRSDSSKLDLRHSVRPTSTRIGLTRFQRHLLLLILATSRRIVTRMCLCVVVSCSAQNHPAVFLRLCFVGLCACVWFFFFFHVFLFSLYFVVLAYWV